MLTEEAAKTLGFKNKFHHKILQPNFVKEGTLWVKEKYPGNIPPSILQNKHKYGYLKKGKTFGFEVKRYIEYYNGTLLYFEVFDT